MPGKGEVYTAFYRYEEGKPSQTAIRLSGHSTRRPYQKDKGKNHFHRRRGKNLWRLSPKFSSSLAIFPPAALHFPHGSVVAKLGLELLRKGEYLDLATFTPLYVRPSEAEMKWQRDSV